MRENIGKYRGQRKDNGEWVYGDLIHFPATTAIGHPDKDGICWEEYDVIPETVGQFTGLLDKNGKEIYEGDLLLTPHEPCSMVAWVSCGWMPFLRDQQTEPRFYLGRDVEIIGNIHESSS